MRGTGIGLCWVLAASLLGCAAAPRPTEPTVFDVRQFGALGDGHAKDTAAFQRALDAAAGRWATVVVPGGNYLIGSVRIGSNTKLQLGRGATLIGSPDPADYPLASVRFEGEQVSGHRALLWAENAVSVAIVGPGTLVGSEAVGVLRRPRGPVMVELTNCQHVLLDGFTDTYRRLWSIHLLNCRDALARNLCIRTSGSNGDGIDVDSSVGVTIGECDIDTGDDCISLKSGRGAAAVRAHQPTANVLIENCRFGSGFAGIGIGSEMSGGISDVQVHDCTFVHGTNGIFLKSRSGRGGYLRDIRAWNLVAESGVRNFLGIGLNNHGIVGTEPVPGLAGIPQVSNIRVTGVTLHDVGRLVDGAHVAPERPIDGLTLANITGTCRRGIALMNVVHADLQNINVSGYTGPLLETYNVSGRGVDGAQPLPAAATQPTSRRSD
jgi:polygalacturonase